MIWRSSHAPTKAATTAGIPNRKSTCRSAFLPTRNNLKILLKKCTTPVNAIARSTGKKIIKTGVRIVPNPNPEKKVRIATRNATADMTTISIVYFSNKQKLPPTHSLSLLYLTPIILPLLSLARLLVATGLVSPSFQK